MDRSPRTGSLVAVEILRWEELSKKRFDEIDRERAVVLVTCSPLEVHGPHLPLGADALEGQGLAERTVRALPEQHRARPFIRLPFIYTATDCVAQPGSINFRTSTIVRVLEDLGRSLAAQGFRTVIVSNFHGSPRHFLSIEMGCHRASRATGIRMLCLFSAMLTRPVAPSGVQAIPESFCDSAEVYSFVMEMRPSSRIVQNGL